MNWRFSPGQRVRKKGGYPFPGVVEAVFTATQLDGSTVERVVVNQTAIAVDGERPTGLLHIFAPEQLEEEDDPRLDPEVEVRRNRDAMLARQGRKP
jgi:hypothetical protein